MGALPSIALSNYCAFKDFNKHIQIIHAQNPLRSICSWKEKYTPYTRKL